MLSAVPVSPGPALPPLGSPQGLFDRAGCPACHYVAEASDSYLDWIALTGYRDTDVLNRLSASRGMCAVHTRGLLARPGAAGRLRVAYQHVIDAALKDVAARPASCPACDYGGSAADRLLGFLLDEATRGDRRTYKEHGGLCLPHLRRAAVCRRGADILWLVRFMIVRLRAPVPGLGLLAGDAAEARPRTALASDPDPSREDPEACVVCRATAEAARALRDGPVGDCLCPQHLREVVTTAGGGAAEVLRRQAALHAARLARVLDGRSRRLGNYLPMRAREALADPDCSVCRGRDAAREREVRLAVRALREPGSGASARLALCIRHAGDVQAADEQAGRAADAYLRVRGRRLIAQLTAAIEHDAGAHMSSSRAQEAAAVWAAAAFADGSAWGRGAATRELPSYGRQREIRLRYAQRRRGSP